MLNMNVRPRNEKDFPSGGSFYVPVRVCSSPYEKDFTSGGGFELYATLVLGINYFVIYCMWTTCIIACNIL